MDQRVVGRSNDWDRICQPVLLLEADDENPPAAPTIAATTTISNG
jgi:hypothetical protein